MNIFHINKVKKIKINDFKECINWIQVWTIFLTIDIRFNSLNQYNWFILIFFFRNELPNDYKCPDIKLLDILYDAAQNAIGKSTAYIHLSDKNYHT